jgi:hypothetical protein
MLAEGDVTAKVLHEKFNRVNMPNLGLGIDDVTSLISYLDDQSKRPKAPAPAPSRSAQEHAHHHH